MARTNEVSPVTPTPAELGILHVLWELGPSTVRQVHERLCEDEPTGYTTVLKFLQIMHRKGLVTRDEASRAHVYTAAVSKDVTQRQLTDRLVAHAFDGSRSALVLRALGGADAPTADELAEIRALIDRLEARNG
jgi:predicted transcriptional regulator